MTGANESRCNEWSVQRYSVQAEHGYSLYSDSAVGSGKDSCAVRVFVKAQRGEGASAGSDPALCSLGPGRRWTVIN